VNETRFPRVAACKSASAFKDHIRSLSLSIPIEERVESAPSSPLARPLEWQGHPIGNRWCILPMEGWDGTEDGRPSPMTLRRWKHFGLSGAKLIWGGEAVAVCHEGRANPNQLWIRPETLGEFAALREVLLRAHRERFQRDDDLLLGLQLTHSGRFCKPNRKDRLEPKILYHHPILDHRFGLSRDYPVLSDDEVRRIIEQFIEAARLAWKCGYSFVDIKHCHGYLGHEFLSSVDRPGPYGGSFENRTRFLREIAGGIRSQTPGLKMVVRLSAFDLVPYRKDEDGRGIPEIVEGDYRCGFGCDPRTPTEVSLQETAQFLRLLQDLKLDLVCISAGSPYYNPHIQRPALFPPSDGYDPPEDPLVGVARQMEITAKLKREFPELLIVGSGYSYLQEYLPHVAQAAVRENWTDFVGLGRMVLAYFDLPADVLEGRPLRTTRLCRTFSDCTTAPRNGMISGCYPLDPFYKDLPEATAMRDIKIRLRNRP
jgi:2,4-dienoyl-CoA reductase-like NADH-dependent reductase (Old Yellow Enzyme family)